MHAIDVVTFARFEQSEMETISYERPFLLALSEAQIH